MIRPASRSLTASVDVVWMLVALTLTREGGVDAAPPVPDFSDQGYAWPKGTYAVPVTGAGQCPGSGYEEDEWLAGQLLQDVVQEWKEGGRVVEGVSGLGRSVLGGRDGSEGGVEYTLTMTREQTRNSFCTKTVAGQFSTFEFMPGRYCLWKKHRCPDGFEEGWIQLDSQSTVTSSGALPDGSYENLTVLMAFCCRSDGNPADAIRLPDIRPFALLRLGHSACQTVENMDTSDGWSSWEGLPTVSEGLYPEMDVDGGELELVTSNRTRVMSCVYRPRNCSGRCLAVFLDVFFVCFIVGVLVLGVCLQLRKSCGMGARAGGGGGVGASSTKLHFFYEEDAEDDDDEEASFGYAPLLPFYDRRRCPLSRDACHVMRDGDSRAPAAVLVARLSSQQSTDDDVDDADEDDEEQDEEDIAWDVTVFVQLPQQQPARHLAGGRTDDVRSAAGPTNAEAAVGTSSPPPPYEETAGVMEPPASVADGDGDALPTQEEPTQHQQQM